MENCGGNIFMGLDEYNDYANFWVRHPNLSRTDFPLRRTRRSPVGSPLQLTSVLNERLWPWAEQIAGTVLRLVVSRMTCYLRLVQ